MLSEKFKLWPMTTWALEDRSDEAEDDVLTILRKFFKGELELEITHSLEDVEMLMAL